VTPADHHPSDQPAPTPSERIAGSVPAPPPLPPAVIDAPAPPLRPVAAAERIETLDVVRGFALLGILVPNMIDFGLPNASELSPQAVLPEAGAWNTFGVWVVYAFFRGKTMALFAMLFGAGVILYGRKFDRRDPLPPLHAGAGLWHRRMGWLLAIGLLHLVLLWDGDILHTYAIAGVGWLWWVRRWRARWLLALGLGVVALTEGLPVVLSLAFMSGEHPQPVSAYEYVPAHAGGIGRIILDRLPEAAGSLAMSLFYFAWVSAGLMTVGMGLTRLGILTGSRSTRTFAVLAAAGLLAGVALPAAALALCLEPIMTDWRWAWPVTLATWAVAPIGAIGYVAALVLLLRVPRLGRAIGWLLAPVGRTALSNYVLHSAAGVFVFYGAGLGLEGRLHHGQLFALTLAFWAGSIVASRLWLRFFRFGPLEWAWRCLTYWRPEPLRRLGSTPSPA